jgi:Kef-type K+ transport system membrane component KefB/Trk K+ transport system NAD-binding subunit
LHQETSFVSLLIVVGLAALVPFLTTQFRRIHIPVVVGEIVVGMIIGRSGFNLIGEDPWLEMLSTLGFAYLMFLSGLEVDFDAVIKQAEQLTGSWRDCLRSPILLAVVGFALTLTVAFLFSLALQAAGWVRDAVLMGLILSTTSLGLVVPVLKERGELRTPYGQTLLLASLTADFATMFLISIYVIFHTSGLTLEMLVILVLLGAFISVWRLLRALQRHPPMERLFERVAEAASHMPARAAFAVGLAFIALAEQIGVEAILGAFLGGALIALLSGDDDRELREQLDVMGYSFFIPLFFIMVGVRFDLGAILASGETLLLAPILLVLAYLIKLIPSLLFRLAYDWRRTLGAGVMLSSRLSLIIAAAAIGLDLGAISAGVNSDVILLAIITCTVSPLLYNRLVPAPAAEGPRSIAVVGDRRGRAYELAARLATHTDPVILALTNGGQLEPPDGVELVRLGEISQDALQQAGLHRAKTLVALRGDDETNLRLCQLATATFRIPNVIAQVNDMVNTDAYAAVGAHPVDPVEAHVTVLENMAHAPNIYRLLSDSAPGQNIRELTMRNASLQDVPIHELRLPGRARIMVIRRNGQFIVPRGDIRLVTGDVLTVVASQEEMDAVCQLIACG